MNECNQSRVNRRSLLTSEIESKFRLAVSVLGGVNVKVSIHRGVWFFGIVELTKRYMEYISHV